MDLPLITVVIPVYNRENHIRKCLEIITNQSYQNLEVLVINDGSSDKSMEIVRGFDVKIIEHDNNQGLSEARNTGINNAKGEFIHFMDDDDIVNKDFYTNMLDAIVNAKADMSCCNLINQKLLSKSQLFSKEKIYTSIEKKYTATYVGKNGYCVRYLFRTNFLRKHKLYFEKGRYIEDLPFSFKAVYYANKIVTVPNAEYIYVYTPNSISNSQDKAKIKKVELDHAHSKKIIFDFAKEHNFKIPAIHYKKLSYFFKKVFTAIKFSLKYKNLKHLKL